MQAADGGKNFPTKTKKAGQKARPLQKRQHILRFDKRYDLTESAEVVNRTG
jgi:hypothetical protein